MHRRGPKPDTERKIPQAESRRPQTKPRRACRSKTAQQHGGAAQQTKRHEATAGARGCLAGLALHASARFLPWLVSKFPSARVCIATPRLEMQDALRRHSAGCLAFKNRTLGLEVQDALPKCRMPCSPTQDDLPSRPACLVLECGMPCLNAQARSKT